MFYIIQSSSQNLVSIPYIVIWNERHITTPIIIEIHLISFPWSGLLTVTLSSPVYVRDNLAAHVEEDGQ